MSRRKIGDCEVLAELKSGGMGEVLLARRLGVHGFEKLVAIKTIRAELRGHSDYRAMFLDEAKLVAQLHHPAIAQVLDFGETEDLLFLVMEYVAGLSFADLFRRATPPLPAGIAVRAMVEICRGLHAAHEATGLDGRPLGVVHRDISPQNLVLTFAGRAKVLDFGIARADQRETPETELGLVKGKPAYMPPEQLHGRRVDRRADVFAAGVVLHEMLTGKRLFGGGSVLEVADRVRHMPIPRPSESVLDLPVGIDEAVLGALERDLEKRTPDAEALAAELERIAQDIGAESLEAFAARELNETREEHQRFLREVTPASGSRRRADEPTLSGDVEDKVPANSTDGTAPAGKPRAVVADLPPADDIAGTATAMASAGLARRPRWPRVGVGLAVVLAAGAWLWWELLRAPAPRESPVAVRAAPAEPAPQPAPVPTEDVEVATTEEPEQPSKEAKTKRRRGPRKKKERKVAVEPAASGFVKVTSDPFYGNVRIDGRVIGPTPLVHHRLTVGRHKVEVVAPDTGEVWHRQVVQIVEGRTVNVTAKK